MEITIKNYQTVLSKDILKHAEKNKVRECDETKKGHYVAYVDEGDESFDVSLVLSPKKEVVDHSCECKSNNTFCRHKAALLMHIAGGKKTKTEVKAKKKASKVEELLDDIDANDLKLWVKEMLQKNKDIEIAFVHYFSARQQQYTPEDVIKITNDAIKAVVGNKKNVDPTQLKKLVDLWGEVHTPIIRNYHGNVADANAFLSFHTLLEALQTFNSNINTSSNRVTKYAEGLQQPSVEIIRQVITDEAWEKAVSYFIKYVHEGKGSNRIRMHYLHHMKNIISVSEEKRKEKLVELLTGLYKQHYSDALYEASGYTKLVYSIVEENGLLARYYKLFKPIRFANEFNVKLIRFLVENGELAVAEKYSQKQIEGNYRDEFNTSYLQLLKEIYTLRNDEEKLAEVVTTLFPSLYAFEDYLFISNRMQEEERKKWRTKILARARNASNNRNYAAIEFVFKLYEYEQQYGKLIGSIDGYTPYSLILQYFGTMVLADKNRLLKAIMDKVNHYGFGLYYDDAEKDAASFPELFDLMVKHYGEDALLKAVKQTEKDGWYYRSNPFFKYLKGRLFLEE